MVQTPSQRPLKEIGLHTLEIENPAAPGLLLVGSADIVLNIAHDFDLKTIKFWMNGHPYIFPSFPVFLQIMSGTKTVQELMTTGSYYELPCNKVIELSLLGTGLKVGGPVSCHYPA